MDGIVRHRHKEGTVATLKDFILWQWLLNCPLYDNPLDFLLETWSHRFVHCFGFSGSRGSTFGQACSSWLWCSWPADVWLTTGSHHRSYTSILVSPLPSLSSVLLYWGRKTEKNLLSWNVYFCIRALVCSGVGLCVTPWTVACQAPLSMEVSRQEYWNGLPFPTPKILHKLG